MRSLAFSGTLDSNSGAKDTGSPNRAETTAQPRARDLMAGKDDHHHDHAHDHEHGSELSETQLRVRALETILTEKGYVDPAALDAIIEAYETRIGPHNGAKVVARA